MSPDTAAPPAPAISISASAARRLAALVAQEANADLMLRVSVSGGGCSGFQYGFAFDAARHEDDATFERDGVRVVVDSVSLGLLAGAEIDYKEDLNGAQFVIKNPQAKTTCGCGSSFST